MRVQVNEEEWRLPKRYWFFNEDFGGKALWSASVGQGQWEIAGGDDKYHIFEMTGLTIQFPKTMN